MALTTITAGNIKDFTNKPLNGFVIFSGPVKLDGTPASIVANGGPMMPTRKKFVVVNGAIVGDTSPTPAAAQVTDTSTSNPANFGYKVEFYDIAAGLIPRPGYDCVQPSGSSWSLDAYVPFQYGLSLLTQGPVGLSAYALYVAQGGNLSESAWLGSLGAGPSSPQLRQLAAAAAVYGTQGSTTSTANDATVGANHYSGPYNTWLLSGATTAAGYLDSLICGIYAYSTPLTVRAYSKTAGSPGGNDTFTQIAKILVQPYQTGQNTFLQGADFPSVYLPAGTYFGIDIASGGSDAPDYRFNSPGNGVAIEFNVTPSDNPLLAHFTSTTGGVQFEFQAVIRSLIAPATPASIIAALTAASTPQYLGDLVSVPDAAGLTGIWGFPTQVINSGPIEQIAMNLGAVSAGAKIRMLVCSGNPFTTNSGDTNNLTVVSIFDISPTYLGNSARYVFRSGTDFTPTQAAAGQFIIPYFGSGLNLNYLASGTSPSDVYVKDTDITSPPSVGDVLTLTVGISAKLCIQVTVGGVPTFATPDSVTSAVAASAATIEAQIAALSAAPGNRRTPLLSQSFAGSSLPANWTASAGSWPVSNGVTSPNNTGGNSGTQSSTPAYLSYGRGFSVEKRVMRLRFQILSSATIVGFGSTNGWNSMIAVDNTDQTLKIYDSNGGTVRVSTPLGFTLQTGTTYTLQIILNEREVTANIGDPASGAHASLSLGNNATDDGSAGGAYNLFGLFDDFLSIYNVKGQFKIVNVSVLADGYKPSVVFLGDSITWGYEATLAGRWATRLGAQISGGWLASGRPGAGSSQVLDRMITEIPFLAPEFMVLMIGTNELSSNASGWFTNIQTIVTQANAAGSQVIICTLTPRGDTDGSGNPWQTIVTTYNAQILSHASIFAAIVRADIATSTGRDGVTYAPSMFAGDKLHPNDAGGAAIAAQFLIDAPMLFD